MVFQKTEQSCELSEYLLRDFLDPPLLLLLFQDAILFILYIMYSAN